MSLTAAIYFFPSLPLRGLEFLQTMQTPQQKLYPTGQVTQLYPRRFSHQLSSKSADYNKATFCLCGVEGNHHSLAIFSLDTKQKFN